MLKRPNSTDIRHASQIKIVKEQVNNFLAELISDGNPLHASAAPRYFYLGQSGTESEERVTEEFFYGDEEDNPRHPGYYAVDICVLDGTSVVPKPFFAVYRDPSSRDPISPREKSAETGYSDLMEEHRLLNLQTKRELKEQIAKNNHLQSEIDNFSTSFNVLRRERLAFEIERDNAIVAAKHMEHERNMVVARCNELEEEARSFKPQIDQFIDGLASRVGPKAEEFFMAAIGSGLGDADGAGDDESDAGVKRPKSPWSGGGGGAGGGAGASNGASSQAAGGGGEATPMSVDPKMPKPEALQKALYYLFWESEHFGRHVHYVIKDPDGGPFVPWWIIRGIVFYYSGTDLGPDPIWPSEVRDGDGADASVAGDAAAGAEASTAAQAPAGAVRRGPPGRGAGATRSTTSASAAGPKERADVIDAEGEVVDGEIVDGPDAGGGEDDDGGGGRGSGPQQPEVSP